MTGVDHSLSTNKFDPYNILWKKKYMLLLKRTENIEKLNLRFVNRLNQLKKISKRLYKERCFLLKRVALHNDSYREVRFYENAELLEEGCSENNKTASTTSSIPKKPLNAFIRYCQEIRDEVDEQNPGISRQDLTKVISNKWNAMSSSDKEIYFDLFDKDKQRYEEEMKQYTQKIAQQKTDRTGNAVSMSSDLILKNAPHKSPQLENSSLLSIETLSSSNNDFSLDGDNYAEN